MSNITPFTSGVSLTPSSTAKSLVVDGWFAETEAMWPGQKFCIQVDEVLLNGRSEFQDILVFKSKTYGNVLVLGKLTLTIVAVGYNRDPFHALLM
jgi:Spermidine synthase tetramerisation domain